MKTFTTKTFILLFWVIIFLITSASKLQAWGFWAHQRINRLAVFTLPPEMLVIYKPHIEYLTEHAVDPDKRRYAIDGEDKRHYIDLDHYGTLPFDSLPRYWNDAVTKYGEDSLQAYGIVPYHLPRAFYQLKKAFENKDLKRILKLSADLGHYVGDSHVPLHTTENYNGQMTGQKGIHGFWESRLPELFAPDYDFLVGRAYFIDDINQEGWDAVFESHTALDSVLSFEKNLHHDFSPDKKYGYESRNNQTVRVYSRDYSVRYHQMLSGMVERRMRTSIRRVGSYWYTAWKMAGSPDLSTLKNQGIDDKPEKFEKKLQIIDRENNGWGSLFEQNLNFFSIVRLVFGGMLVFG